MSCDGQADGRAAAATRPGCYPIATALWCPALAPTALRIFCIVVHETCAGIAAPRQRQSYENRWTTSLIPAHALSSSHMRLERSSHIALGRTSLCTAASRRSPPSKDGSRCKCRRTGNEPRHHHSCRRCRCRGSNRLDRRRRCKVGPSPFSLRVRDFGELQQRTLTRATLHLNQAKRLKLEGGLVKVAV